MPFGEARTLGFNNQVVDKVVAGNVTLDKTGLTIKNNFGATIFKVEVSKDAWFLYLDTGSATQGALIASSASGTGTDDFGNPFQGPGITSYGNVLTFFAQLNAARLLFADTVNAAFSAGIIGLTTVTLSDDSIEMLSPLAASTDIQSSLILQRKATPGPAHAIFGNCDVALPDVASAQPAGGILLHSKSGQPRVFSSRAGDTNDYSYGSMLAIASHTTLINSVSEIALTDLILPVGIGTYRITGVVRGVNGATLANQAVGIEGFSSAVASSVNVDVKIYSATAGAFKNYGEITALGGRVSTGNLAISEAFQAEYDGLIVFSHAGTISFTGSNVTSSADPWTSQLQSRLRLEPYL